MKKTIDRNAAVAEGLEQGRWLGVLLRAGTDEKRARMLEELQESVAFRETQKLVRSLATCADVSLGNDDRHSSFIREAASRFRDAVVAHPPESKRAWKELGEALMPRPERERTPAPAAAAPVDAEPATLRNPERYILPTPTSDDHDCGDDENVRYRYLDEKDGS